MKSTIFSISNLDSFNSDNLKSYLKIATKWFIEPFTKSNHSRGLFCIGLALLIAYCYVLALAHFYLYYDYSLTKVFLKALIAIPIVVIIVRLVREIRFKEIERSNKISLLFGLIFGALTFCISFIWQLAYWPGSFSYDSIFQYSQAVSGSYNNWHPIIHTLLFFKLPLSLYNEPSFIITYQIFLFSLAVGFLFFTLYKFGFNIILCIVAWCFIALNPNTNLVMLFPWKDSAFSISSLVLFTFLIYLIKSKGAWSSKILPWVLFGILAFLTNSVRHNAILLIFPIFLILFACIKFYRRKIVISFAIFLSLTFGAKHLIPCLFNAGYGETPKIELLGMPMTILCDEYKYSPNSLSKDANEFMESIATKEDWKHYSSGSFNTLKAYSEQLYKVNQSNDIFSYIMNIDKSGYDVGIKAFLRLTAQVWAVNKKEPWQNYTQIIKNDFGIGYISSKIFKIYYFEIYKFKIFNSKLKFAFGYLGIMILILMFLAASKVGKSDIVPILLVFSPLAYDFGTMLLLSGEDQRFFHFTFIVILPLMFMIISTRQKACCS